MVDADLLCGILKAASTLTYLLFMVLNLHTVVIFPQPTIDQQSYFTPGIWVYLVLPIIYILLVCPILYDRTSERGKLCVTIRISLEFLLLAVLYTILLTLRAIDYPIATFFLSLYLICLSFGISNPAFLEYSPISEEGKQLLTIFPLSVCQAWNTVVFGLSVLEAFGVNSIDHDAGTETRFWVVVAFFFLLLNVVLSVFPRRIGGPIVSSIITWSLLSVSAGQQSSGFFPGAASFFASLSLLCSIKVLHEFYSQIPRGDVPSRAEPVGPPEVDSLGH